MHPPCLTFTSRSWHFLCSPLLQWPCPTLVQAPLTRPQAVLQLQLLPAAHLLRRGQGQGHTKKKSQGQKDQKRRDRQAEACWVGWGVCTLDLTLGRAGFQTG